MAQREQAILRQHPFLPGVNVIYAPSRSGRPYNLEPAIRSKGKCPFCNNVEISNYEVWDEDEKWTLKVVDNLYSALVPKDEYCQGKQEIIIETPNHDTEYHSFSAGHIANILSTYQSRINALRSESYFKTISIFKNKGIDAGATQEHEHSQLYVLGFVPLYLLAEKYALQDYRSRVGRCALCNEIEMVVDSGTCVLSNDQESVAFNPHYSEAPYEAWIFPTVHTPNFTDLSGQQIMSFSKNIKAATTFLVERNIPYNIIIQDTPEDAGHVRVRVVPRSNKQAGLELATHIFINPVLPEEATVAYRPYFE